MRPTCTGRFAPFDGAVLSDCAIFVGRCYDATSSNRPVLRRFSDVFRPPKRDAFSRPIRVPYDEAATSRSSAGLSWMIKVEPFSSTMSFFLNSDSMRVIVSRLVPVS